MPLYSFRCKNKKCKTNPVFEVLVPYSKIKKVKCPDCGSTRKEQQVVPFAFSFKNPEDTKMWRKSHDYRFKTKLPKAMEERQRAAEAAAGDSSPYNPIDDVGSGKYFGEVK